MYLKEVNYNWERVGNELDVVSLGSNGLCPQKREKVRIFPWFCLEIWQFCG